MHLVGHWALLQTWGDKEERWKKVHRVLNPSLKQFDMQRPPTISQDKFCRNPLKLPSCKTTLSSTAQATAGGIAATHMAVYGFLCNCSLQQALVLFTSEQDDWTDLWLRHALTYVAYPEYSLQGPGIVCNSKLSLWCANTLMVFTLCRRGSFLNQAWKWQVQWGSILLLSQK